MTLNCFTKKRLCREALAGRIVEICSTTLMSQQYFHLVLSGGNTPKKLYELLASNNWRTRIDWNRVRIFFGDERCVPWTEKSSNYGMVYHTMLKRLPIPQENIYRMKGEREPQVEADRYQRLLGSLQREDYLFDCVLLGLGSDGHTASLFPGDRALQSQDLVVAVDKPRIMQPAVARISLTLRALTLSKQIFFHVVGRDKEDVVKAVCTRERGYPASLVKGGAVSWFLSDMDCNRFADCA